MILMWRYMNIFH